MKNIKNYNLFCESIEDVKNNMGDNIDFSKIEQDNNEIKTLQTKITNKKEELEKKLDMLEKLETSTFTEDDVKKIEDQKLQIKKSIDDLKNEIKTIEDAIADFKSKISDVKEPID
jgi:chromosome segregation ATPase